jgi:hypothetical protein
MNTLPTIDLTTTSTTSSLSSTSISQTLPPPTIATTTSPSQPNGVFSSHPQPISHPQHPAHVLYQNFQALSCWDTNRLLQFLITNCSVFSRFGFTLQHRSILFELKRTRNDWAHQVSFSDEELYRVLDNIQRILFVSDAPFEAQIIGNTRKELIVVMAHKITQERSHQITSPEVCHHISLSLSLAALKNIWTKHGSDRHLISTFFVLSYLESFEL